MSSPEALTTDLTAQLREVRGLLDNQDISSAEETLTAILASFPDAEAHPLTLLFRGRVARFRERYKDARTLLRRAARLPSVTHEAIYELGRTLIDCNRLEWAVEVLQNLAEDESAFVPLRIHALSGLCVAYTALERDMSAQFAIESAASADVISAQVLADEGYRLAALGALEEASSQLARAIQLDTACAEAFALLANIFLMQGKVTEAKDILMYGLNSAPESLRLFSQLGEVHMSGGEYVEAAAFLGRAVELSPKGAHADSLMLTQARAQYLSGRVGEAEVTLRTLMERFPRSAYRREAKERLDALSQGRTRSFRIKGFPRSLQKRHYCGPNTLANVLNFHGYTSTQEEIAEKVFTQGARWHDIIGYLRSLKGVKTYAFLSTLEQLKDILDQQFPVIVGEYSGLDGHCIAVIGYDDHMGVVIAQDPLFFEPVEISYSQFLRAWAFTDNLAVVVCPKDRASVIEGFQREGEEAIDDWITVLATSAAGKLEKALAQATKLSKREPEYASPRRTRVELLIARGQFEEAREALELELADNAKSYWALRYLGDVSLKLGDFHTCWDAYSKAVQIFPNDAVLHYIRGEIALSAGDRKRGRTELFRSLDLQPALLPPRLRLARDYMDASDPRHALYHTQAVLEIHPGHEEAQELQKLIQTSFPDYFVSLNRE